MIEFYHSGQLLDVYFCTEVGHGQCDYMAMINDGWNQAEKIDGKVIKLSDVTLDLLINSKSYKRVSTSTTENPLLYIRDLGSNNIRVPFFIYQGRVILLFPFKKKDKKTQSKLFDYASELQHEIINWIDHHGFPSH